MDTKEARPNFTLSLSEATYLHYVMSQVVASPAPDDRARPLRDRLAEFMGRASA
jgi:hypothetical protein